MPAPPATVNAPVVVDVDPVTAGTANAPLIVRPPLIDAVLLIVVMPPPLGDNVKLPVRACIVFPLRLKLPTVIPVGSKIVLLVPSLIVN